jgi:type II secretion system protein N
MSPAIQNLLQILKRVSRKENWFVLILSTLFFLFILFPVDDLSDLVTAQISKATQNQIYLQFDSMDLDILPSPAISLSKVYVESPMTPPLTANELNLSPSISAILSKKPGGQVSAKGFLSGDIDIEIGKGKATESGTDRHKLNLQAKNISLQEVRQLASLPLMLKGKISVKSEAQGDLAVVEQPDADLTIEVENFELPSGNVQTPMGPLTLPELKLGKVELKGRLSNGRFNIENASLGKDGDEFIGDIKGGIAMTLSQRDGRLTPAFGAYNFDIKLDLKTSFQERASLFLTFIDAYKSQQVSGARYSFKVSGSNFMTPPTISLSR